MLKDTPNSPSPLNWCFVKPMKGYSKNCWPGIIKHTCNQHWIRRCDLTIFVTDFRKQPAVSGVADKLCHKLFPSFKKKKLAILLKLVKVSKIIIITDSPKIRKLINLRIPIFSVMEKLQTSDLRSSYPSLKGFLEELHYMM